MQKKLLIIFFIAISFVITRPVSADDFLAKNTGFIQGNIWFSQSEIKEGATVKIYTFVTNSTKEKIDGQVQFFDKTVLLAEKNFSLEPETAGSVSMDWKVTAGDHNISAKIINAQTIDKTESSQIFVEFSQLAESKKFVSKQITAADETAPAENKVFDLAGEQVQKVGDYIAEHTPEAIKGPVSATYNILDTWRSQEAETLDAKKDEVKKNMAAATETKDAPAEAAKSKNPFQYVALFFYTAAAYIFSHRLIFYILSALVIFLILRFIYKRVV